MPLTDAGRRAITEGWFCALFDRYGKSQTEWFPVLGEQVNFGMPRVVAEVVEARVHTTDNEEMVFPLDVRVTITPSCSVILTLGGFACSE